MAKDVLSKTVRIDDKTYDPKGAKLEIWTKGRHKYVIHHLDKKGIQPSSLTYYYIDGDKISASLTDDEVIKAWLSQIETVDKKVYKVIQDPYSDEPVTKRVYGDGKSFYYLNNGCSISIEWRGDKPNPDFTLGTFSNPDDAERYYRKKDTNGVRNGPDRYLKDTVENPVIITSSVDDANDKSKLPTSSWVVEEPFDNGIAGISVEMTEPNYRDKSTVDNKVVTVNMPTGFTENDGKGYLVWTNHGLQYNTKALPNGTAYSRTLLIDTQGNVVDPGSTTSTTGLRAVEAVTQGDIITHFARGTKDSNIVSEVIEKFKSMVVALHGISRSDYDLKLCEPDSEACKLIEYKSPLESPNNPPQQAAINDTPPGPSQSSTKIKLNIQGLFGSDGTTPGSTSSVFEIKAKTDMPTFTIWTGEIPQSEEIDVFNDLQELDDEYIESGYSGEEEQTLKLSAGEGLKTDEEYVAEVNQTYAPNDPATSNTPGGGTGLVSTGTYTSQLPNESSRGTGSVKPGFNGVPYYQQFDSRWANVIYGRANDGTFVEATVKPTVGSVNVTWNGGTYTIKCDHYKGNKGFSSIQGGGCGITSTSMIISYWAVKGKCKPTSPVKIAKLASENGSRPGPPCNGTQPGGRNGGFGKAIKANFNIDFDASNGKEAQELVKKGFPVLFCGQNFSGKNSNGRATKPYGGHFIVITGYDNGKWRVNDPGRNVDDGGIAYFDTFPSGGFWKFIPAGMSA
jgi:hypothetical protein